jgi:hypothetical protein
MSEQQTMGILECKEGVYTHYRLSYKFERTDMGRSMSRRPRQSNDCTVRALATVKGMAYDDAYDLLATEGRKCAHGFKMPEWLNSQPWARKIPFQAVKGQRRMNPSTFCVTYPKGRYICRVAKHVFAITDGVVHDTHPERPDRCIYTAWEIA